MAKKNVKCVMKSFGIYQRFEKADKDLPRFIERTTIIPAQLDIEFGYILHITGAKSCELTFEIDHPPFKNDDGKTAPPFTGQLFIKSNDYRFFLGDTLWNPIEDKIGPWTLTTFCQNKEIAKKTLTITKQP